MPPEAQIIARPLINAGFQCYVVGGAVRDMALGKKPHDLDFATDALPEKSISLFRRTVATGIQHGTITVLTGSGEYELTTFRRDGSYGDGRRPDRVDYSNSLADDLSRRDFTMNALAINCADSKLIDLYGGLADIEAGLIRAIGNPLQRFQEDGLRLMRAIRFASSLGFSIEKETLEAITQSVDMLKRLSAERIRDELSKTLVSLRPSLGLRLLAETGIMSRILPELWALDKIEQDPPHCYGALEHSIMACSHIAPHLEWRLAALFHDIGKAPCLQVDKDGIKHFFGHDQASAKMTEGILKRLKYPNTVIDTVTCLIANHMTRYSDTWSDAAIRRLLIRIGQEYLPGFLALLRADEMALGPQGQLRRDSTEALAQRINQVLAKDNVLSLKDLAIDGKDLQKLGFKPGPKLGLALGELLEAVIDDPSLNTACRLQELAKGLCEKYRV